MAEQAPWAEYTRLRFSKSFCQVMDGAGNTYLWMELFYGANTEILRKFRCLWRREVRGIGFECIQCLRKGPISATLVV